MIQTVIIPVLLLAVVLLTGCGSVMRGLTKNYKDPYHKKLASNNIVEKYVQLGNTTMHYWEGPDNGPALLMLHAQMMDGYSYSRVLPALSKSFHVFAVDYDGHGKTISAPDSMTANKIGNDLAAFMETVIRKPAFVTGNSSGGLLTVWLAANKPEWVKAVLLEDPPLFSAEYPRVKKTIAYRSFTTCHNYLEPGDHGDFLVYWLNSNQHFIENHAGKKALPKLLSMIKTYRAANPGKPVELRLLPSMMRMIIRGMSSFDPHFGEAFYDGSWNQGFDHAQALQEIKCPALLLQADFTIEADGTLNGAMDQNDASKAMSLLKQGTYKKIDASHVVHLDKPKEFIQLTEQFFLGKNVE